MVTFFTEKLFKNRQSLCWVNPRIGLIDMPSNKKAAEQIALEDCATIVGQKQPGCSCIWSPMTASNISGMCIRICFFTDAK